MSEPSPFMSRSEPGQGHVSESGPGQGHVPDKSIATIWEPGQVHVSESGPGLNVQVRHVSLFLSLGKIISMQSGSEQNPQDIKYCMTVYLCIYIY